MSKLDDIITEHREWMRGIRTDHLVGTSNEQTKQQLKDLMLEIVGKNGDVPKHDNMSMTEIRYQAAELGMNSLRADMRQRIQEL